MSTESGEPTKEAAFFTTIRSWRIVRSDQRAFGGVLAGLGQRIGMAPAPARILFVLIAIVTGGLTLLAYAAAWALLPDSEGRIIIQDFGRGTPNVGALVAIGVMTVIGLITVDNWGLGNVWRWWGATDGAPQITVGSHFLPRILAIAVILIPIALIAGIVWLIVWSVRYGRTPQDRAAQGFARMPDGSVPQAPVAPEPVVAAAAAPRAAAAEAAVAEAVIAETTLADTTPATPPLANPPVAPVASSPPAAVPPTPPVYSAPKPPHAPKPRVPGPGKFGYLAALAMIPIALAITLYLDSTDQLGVFPQVAAGVIWVAGLGLILVINALRGRKAGFLGFVSFIALIPLGFTIAYADDIRERYETSSHHWWTGEIRGSDTSSEYVEPTMAAEEPAPPPFNTSGAFLDYETIAINGMCYESFDEWVPEPSGTVRMSAVTANQSITITSTDTLLAIPQGTSLTIVNGGGNDGMASVTVSWADRDVSCDLNSVGSPAVELANADTPMLTVYLDDTQTAGYMTLTIEEN